ncbi:hypothetical protein P170DRAFT_445402 [Aspergillus steynii IBT 23096]|uniref:Uncharacterized protein n=1 Tax=Aspergillus steynii IBT 23096 TaxID=1392250 RepID=A0A2I2GAT3_9EURO|nr:uncharacterized protein P170DRAFT_445402 [Aspergillus steynii IBT 23096]PLB49991.1 hypothetical protein P170DRAFT_445402 [Aspergillus steynii IBT 23096]
MVQSQTKIGIFFIVGALAQLSGYTSRLFLSQDVCNHTAYGIQSALLLLGPTLIMFSVVLTQTEFAQNLDAGKHCFIPLKWQRSLYLVVNTVLAIIQAAGGILTVSRTSHSFINRGTKITIATYIIQTLFWSFTFAENIYMTAKFTQHPTAASSSLFPSWKAWNQLIGLAVSIIAFGRNIMRLTMAGGIDFLVQNGWPSYAFDGFQMGVVLGAWAAWYLPGRCREVAAGMEFMGLEGRGGGSTN